MLGLHDNVDDDNDEDGKDNKDDKEHKDNLVWFANDMSFTLSHLCRRIGGPTNTAVVVAAAAANVNS